MTSACVAVDPQDAVVGGEYLDGFVRDMTYYTALYYIPLQDAVDGGESSDGFVRDMTFHCITLHSIPLQDAVDSGEYSDGFVRRLTGHARAKAFVQKPAKVAVLEVRGVRGVRTRDRSRRPPRRRTAGGRRLRARAAHEGSQPPPASANHRRAPPARVTSRVRCAARSAIGGAIVRARARRREPSPPDVTRARAQSHPPSPAPRAAPPPREASTRKAVGYVRNGGFEVVGLVEHFDAFIALIAHTLDPAGAFGSRFWAKLAAIRDNESKVSTTRVLAGLSPALIVSANETLKVRARGGWGGRGRVVVSMASRRSCGVPHAATAVGGRGWWWRPRGGIG